MSRLLLAGFFLLASVVSAETQDLLWPDLQGEVGEFEDPFNELTSDELFDLGTVVRLRGLRDRSEQPLSKTNAADLAAKTQSLHEAGIDIDALLAKRKEIIQLRRQRASALRTDYDGQTVRVPGYLIPLDINKGRATEFLLVPWVGACIHTPPPPPNQIVYVKTAKRQKVGRMWDPVHVKGTMQSGDISKNLYLIDGAAEIAVGYTLSKATVAPYSDQE